MKETSFGQICSWTFIEWTCAFFCFGLYLSTNPNYVHSVEEEITEEGKALVLCWLAVSCMLVSTHLTQVGSSSFIECSGNTGPYRTLILCLVVRTQNPSQTCPHHRTCFSSRCILAPVQFTNGHTLIQYIDVSFHME